MTNEQYMRIKVDQLVSEVKGLLTHYFPDADGKLIDCAAFDISNKYLEYSEDLVDHIYDMIDKHLKTIEEKENQNEEDT